MSAPAPLGYLFGLSAAPRPLNVGDRLTIGRDPQNTCFLTDALASRRHAVLEVSEDGVVTIEDLESSNHTYLNESRLAPHSPAKLRSEDNVRIGGTVMTFIANSVAATPDSVEQRKKAVFESMKTVNMERPSLREKKTAVDAARKSPSESSGVSVTQVTGKKTDPDIGGPADGSFSTKGNLSELMFAQLLQFLHNAQKTGELKIEAEGDEVIIGITAGEVTFASMEDMQGVKVIHEVARWLEGSFQFTSMEHVDRPRNVVHPTVTLILKCCQILDEGSR